MIDAQTIIAGAVLAATAIVGVIVKLQGRSDVEAIRLIVQSEFKPARDAVDRTEHEVGVLRQEIAHALTHSEMTASRLQEFESDIDRRLGEIGEAFDRRTTFLEERMRGIITDMPVGE